MNITDSIKNRQLIVSVGFGIFALFYMVIGYYIEAQNGMNIIGTEIDRVIPFIPITVWYYLGAYIFILLFGIYKVLNSDLFWPGLKIIAMASLISFVMLSLFPFSYPRPQIDDVGYVIGATSYSVIELDWDNLSPLIVRLLYGFDPPTCTFPSFHITLSTCFAIIMWRLNKKLGIVIWVLTIGLLFAILTTKQHFVLDGIMGMFVAWLGSITFKQEKNHE